MTASRFKVLGIGISSKTRRDGPVYVDVRKLLREKYGDDFRWLQSIGCTDKEGIEIYEGDIVEVDGRPNDSWVWVCKGVIARDDEGAWRVKIDNKEFHHYVSAWTWAIKVISNIFANPNGLKKDITT
jgi:uncharacterized phage protein (TIGR01671 family)